MNDWQQQSRPVVFGEVLFDQFADGNQVLGGAPFNVACHLQAFGLAPMLVSRVGDDVLGRRIHAAMEQRGMDLCGLQLDATHRTGTVDVSFSAGAPAFDIVANSAYDYIDAAVLPPLPWHGLLYHGSLALRNPASFDALQCIKRRVGLPCFVDVNLRPPWWQREVVLDQLRSARWIKLNQGELEQLLPRLSGIDQRAEKLLADLAAELLVVTRGESGAIAYTADGGRARVRPEKLFELVDPVGAGDAFSSVLMLGWAQGWSLIDTLRRAQQFAGAMVGVRGATVADGEFYRPFLEAWSLA